ncbi:MAG: S8 family serine peptidase [Humibacillus sp.]|nr:S8 family serine peptidase [Humibacillus sp.]MDN5779238.1 S8 family serine peptidase [Humibacillus sp.]
MRSVRGAMTFVVVAAMSAPLTAAALSPPDRPVARPVVQPGQLPANSAAQVAALQTVKSSLTVAERKLDSRLALSLRARSNGALRSALPALDALSATRSATVAVDIDVSDVTDSLLTRLRATGASIVYSSPTVRSVRANVPPNALIAVAGWKDVRSVREAGGAKTSDDNLGDPGAPGALGRTVDPNRTTAEKHDRATRVEAALKKALKPSTNTLAAGTVTSEGDQAHAADTARQRFKVTGTGVKVCALSDGVDSIAASIASGDLPPVDVLPGQAGSGDEGTAMLEIIHDLAPNAELGFATAFTSAASFADNIRALRSQADCDIIVDDVLYYAESPFQDGPIAQAVNTVTDAGALYFSSAGNEGNVIDATSGNYEGDFVSSGRGVGKFAGEAHDFDPGPGVQVFEPLSDESYGVVVPLFWANPLGGATDDYDLYLFDSAGNVTGFSQQVQNGTQDPLEILQTGFGAGQRLAVVKFSGADRYFQLSALGGRYSDSADGLKAYVTPGMTRGHSATVNAFSTAAAPAADPLPFALETGDPPNPSGPFPGAFTRKQLPERFTSDGPRRVFFQADGTPYTPGNTTATGGSVRQKPDLTAADGVSTTVPGFTTFFGTSAAAPHAAALAALVLSGNPSISSEAVRSALTSTAIDLAPAGVDNRTGHGVVLATRLLRQTGATPQPLVRAGVATVAPAGDGDPYLEPGESGVLTLPVTNVGDGRATSVSARLTSTNPMVTISPASRSYGAVPPGATKSRTFTIALAADYPVGKPVSIGVKVAFVGILSPTNQTVSLPTGQPASAPTAYTYTGAPVPIPDSDEAGASVTIPVAGSEYASAITFSVDGTTCSTDIGSTTVGIDHTWVGDLTGTLTSPSGATATVFSRNGGSGNNLCQVVFDDTAASSINTVSSSTAPFTGTWKPISPLSSLLSAPANGDWTFTVVDGAGGDTGTLRAVTLNLTGYVQ